jgi:hypothetical protein
MVARVAVGIKSGATASAGFVASDDLAGESASAVVNVLADGLVAIGRI